MHVGPAWIPLKKSIREELGVDDDREQFCFADYTAEDLEEVIDTQKKIVDAQKKRGDKRLYNILIIVDDFADSPSFTRHSSLLWMLLREGPSLCNLLDFVGPAVSGAVADNQDERYCADYLQAAKRQGARGLD